MIELVISLTAIGLQLSCAEAIHNQASCREDPLSYSKETLSGIARYSMSGLPTLTHLVCDTHFHSQSHALTLLKLFSRQKQEYRRLETVLKTFVTE